MSYYVAQMIIYWLFVSGKLLAVWNVFVCHYLFRLIMGLFKILEFVAVALYCAQQEAAEQNVNCAPSYFTNETMKS